MAFYDQVEKICKGYGVSLTQIAENAGLTSKSATGWKNGAVPRNSTLKAIADRYHVTVEWLIGDDPLPDKWSSTKETSEYGALSSTEKQLIDMYRELPEMGRMRLIQAVLSVYDGELKK